MARAYKRLAWILVLQSFLIIGTLRAHPSLSRLEILTPHAIHTFQVEVVQTPKDLEQGLMNRSVLAENAGMLFDFGKPQKVSLWMKNTLIALDMLFIDNKGQIVYIHENAIPHSLKLIKVNQPVKAVLEIKSGTVKKLGLQIGDLIKLY